MKAFAAIILLALLTSLVSLAGANTTDEGLTLGPYKFDQIEPSERDVQRFDEYVIQGNVKEKGLRVVIMAGGPDPGIAYSRAEALRQHLLAWQPGTDIVVQIGSSHEQVLLVKIDQRKRLPYQLIMQIAIALLSSLIGAVVYANFIRPRWVQRQAVVKDSRRESVRFWIKEFYFEYQATLIDGSLSFEPPGQEKIRIKYESADQFEQAVAAVFENDYRSRYLASGLIIQEISAGRLKLIKLHLYLNQSWYDYFPVTNAATNELVSPYIKGNREHATYFDPEKFINSCRTALKKQSIYEHEIGANRLRILRSEKGVES